MAAARAQPRHTNAIQYRRAKSNKSQLLNGGGAGAMQRTRIIEGVRLGDRRAQERWSAGGLGGVGARNGAGDTAGGTAGGVEHDCRGRQRVEWGSGVWGGVKSHKQTKSQFWFEGWLVNSAFRSPIYSVVRT